jgi:hypothetical protein
MVIDTTLPDIWKCGIHQQADSSILEAKAQGQDRLARIPFLYQWSYQR